MIYTQIAYILIFLYLGIFNLFHFKRIKDENRDLQLQRYNIYLFLFTNIQLGYLRLIISIASVSTITTYILVHTITKVSTICFILPQKLTMTYSYSDASNGRN